MTSAPDLTSNTKEAARGAVAKVNVSLPATVVSYDEATQTASVRIVPCFRRRDPSQGGAVVCYDAPDLHNVPVGFPGGDAWGITWPLSVGDTGRIVVCDRSMDEWKSSGGTRSEPQDTRRHDLSDAVFLPDIASPRQPRGAEAVDGAAMVIRGDLMKLGSSAASSAVALAPLVQADSTTLKVALAAAATAAASAAVPGDGGAVAFATFGSTLATALGLWPSSVGATKVQAE